jgi:hypothetical protein
MRAILIAFPVAALAFTMNADRAAAQNYPWCAEYGGGGEDFGGTNCGFVTLKQCMETVSGVGGFCVHNPMDQPPVQPSRPRRERPRQR